jgi:hypothetical protein
MRIAVKALVTLVTLLISFVTWRTVVLSRSGELMWFVAAHSVTLTNGKIGEALLHHCCQSRIWILTHRTGVVRESYAIIPPVAGRAGYVWRCDGWVAPWLPVFPYPAFWSDIPFDCDSEPAALTHHRAPVDREIRFGDHSVAFLADDGSRVALKWE